MRSSRFLLLLTASLLAGNWETGASATLRATDLGDSAKQPASGRNSLSAQEPAAQASTDDSTRPPVIPEHALGPNQQAWHLLESACAGDKTADHATAIRVLGLLPGNAKAQKLAEQGLENEKAEIREASALALGNMGSRVSIQKLRAVLEDTEPSVVLAAAHSLELLHDDSAYAVYYEILTHQRKIGKGLVASQMSVLKDKKKMAELGFEEGIGFIPFAGMGWVAVKTIMKDDSSPIRAAAAKVLANDPDPSTTQALVDAAGDKSWIVRVAALEALARRGDRSALKDIEVFMYDDKTPVKYTAAAAVLRLGQVKGKSEKGTSGNRGKKSENREEVDK